MLALPVALFGVSGSAQATTAPFVPVTDFVIDGNPAGPNDFDAPYGPGTTPEGHPTTGIYYNHRNIDMGATTGLTTGCALANFGFVDDTAGSGVKIEDGPIWASGGPAPNGKTDIDWIDIAAEKVNINNQLHDILYVGYQKCGGTGTWQAMLYLDDGDGLAPTEGDLNGDFLFIFTFDPSSGAVTFTMAKMVGGVWTPQSPPTDAIQGKASGDYGEVALNLTHLGILPDTSCRSIAVDGQGAAITGGALTSAVKDLVAVIPLEISNCGALDVSKVSSKPGVTSPALFHYSVDQAPASDALDYDIVHDTTLAVNLNGSGSSTEPDADVKELDANITIGGTHNWTNVIAQPDYTIAETTPVPSPWSLKTISCTYTDIFVDPPVVKTVVVYENGAYTTNRFLVPPSTFDNTAIPAQRQRRHGHRLHPGGQGQREHCRHQRRRPGRQRPGRGCLGGRRARHLHAVGDPGEHPRLHHVDVDLPRRGNGRAGHRHQQPSDRGRWPGHRVLHHQRRSDRTPQTRQDRDQ